MSETIITPAMNLMPARNAHKSHRHSQLRLGHIRILTEFNYILFVSVSIFDDWMGNYSSNIFPYNGKFKRHK